MRHPPATAQGLTVRARLRVWLLLVVLPVAAAVITIVEVTGEGGVGVGVGPGTAEADGLLLPPPQEFETAANIKTGRSTTNDKRRCDFTAEQGRFRAAIEMKAHKNAINKIAALRDAEATFGSPITDTAAIPDEVVTVRFVLIGALSPPTAILAGLKPQFAPVGSPEQENDKVPRKPPLGVTVTATVPGWLLEIVIAGDVELSA